MKTISSKQDVSAGSTVGRLTVVQIHAVKTGKQNHYYCRCACTCGKTKSVRIDHLRNGKIQSCGCLSSELLINRNMTHGLSKSTSYKCWAGMINRCQNPKDPRFKDYGGRGISVCERWLSFENFLEDMGQRPSMAHSIDRKNNDLGYFLSNCYWATLTEQQNNTRRNKFITFQGQTKTAAQWARHLGLDVVTLRARIQRGWPLHRALVQCKKQVSEVQE